MINTWLTETFKIKYPIIMAPMFLASSKEMLIEAAKAGIMGCIPAANWRTPELFEEGIQELKKECPGPFGINLIVNKSNIYLAKQIEICEKYVPDFIITSLGSPEEVIKKCRPQGTKIFCDVVDVTYAQKVESLGADAIIAVNSGAGGHAGPVPTSILVPMLQKHCKIPVISAGGVGTGSGLLSSLSLGAEGVSIGSPFIATDESPVSEEYKDAVVKYGAKDIVMTNKISGSACTVINTPYVQKIGVNQNFIEAFLNSNRQFKKYAKMLTYYKGMKAVEKAAFAATYKTVWVAGPSIEFITKKEKVSDVISRLISEYEEALETFKNKLG
ncbi:nitronate monooxygenase family protein [Bacteriovorax sp. Seq25_V]|uniref:NAD(P)H-dependent flavin oxidoreductase n=1 Tax=Bacteriovorax sp. Seq25_V TaxID=1201288 RepID=UPI000389FF29|nr:nitronate monooxygenase [Bacteriovorax sp. Seq25_V]EQC47435.1 thiazole biosynthesis protein ThiG-like protein [Bacteriovorax sp. Seq25_V]